MYGAWRIPVLMLLVATTACSDDGTATPMEVVDAETEAVMAADSAAFAELWSDEAVFAFPDGSEEGVWDEAPWPVDDFDGDGTGSMLDYAQADVALSDAFERTISTDCTEVSDTEVRCTEVVADVFDEIAGLEDPGMDYTTTVQDGRIVAREMHAPPGDDWTEIDAYDEAYFSAWTDYERWVETTHPDDHDEMFQGPCCRGEMATTMESVALHDEMIPEYAATLDG
jgi:hypothetical protein